MSKNPISHSKFLKTVKGKSIYFNTPHTYKVLYVHTGVLSAKMVITAFEEAKEQLIESFPEKKGKFSKCTFDINMPTSYDKITGETHYQDFSYVYVSDWEVGNAIMGFNFDESTRTKIVSCEGNIPDINTEIEERYPELEILNQQERLGFKKRYTSQLNRMSDVMNTALCISDVLDHPDKMEILLEIIFNIAKINTFGGSELIDLLRYLIESEVTLYVTKMEEIGSDVSGEFILSILHVKLTEHINKLIINLAEGKFKERNDIMNLSRFIGFMYGMGLFDTKKFRMIFDVLYPDLFETDVIEDNTLMGILKMLEVSHSAIKTNCGELYEDIKNLINDFGELKHNTLMENIDNENIKDGYYKNPCTSYFKHEILEPLCFLPGIVLPKNLKELVEKHVEDNCYTECKNLQIGAIKAYGAHVETSEHSLKPEIFATRIPKWVNAEMIRKRLKQYSSSPDEIYPIIKEKSSESDNYYNVTAIFDNDSKYRTDYLFAVMMTTKWIIYSKDKKEHVIISFRISKSS